MLVDLLGGVAAVDMFHSFDMIGPQTFAGDVMGHKMPQDLTAPHAQRRRTYANWRQA
jgi:hypothetical protein